MSEYVIVADAVAPLSDSVGAAGALGLATALAAAGHRVSLLSQAPAEQAGRQPGLARRLRLVPASIGGTSFEVPLFEARGNATAAHLFVLAADPLSRGRTAALLSTAAAALARDGLFKPEVVIAWGETAALALASLPATRRIFVLPEGSEGDPLPAEEIAVLGEADDLGAGQSLLARGLMSAELFVVPSPSAANGLAGHAALASRAADQPIAVVRMGCDETPHDPQSDPALPHHFSADAPAGKAECRRTLAKRLSLAVGPRTLVVACPALDSSGEGLAILEALGQLGGLDLAVVIRASSDRAVAERLKLLVIQNPGKIAVLPEHGAGPGRELIAGADAVLLAATDDLTGRAPGLALRYGTLPIAPDAGACGDFLVDYDPASATGTALLHAPKDAFEIVGALRRALLLRVQGETWQSLVVSLMRSAPKWANTVAVIEALTEAPAVVEPPALVA